MYSTIGQIYALANKSEVQGCGKMIVRENFETPREYQEQMWYYDTPFRGTSEEKFQGGIVNPTIKGGIVNPNSDSSKNSTETVDHSSNPDLWGSHQWKALHYSAAGYEDNPSKITQERMKQRILSLPFEIPCAKCRSHCSAYIERSNIDKAVSSRDELFRFYFDFHNKVNERLGKTIIDFEDAKRMFGYN